MPPNGYTLVDSMIAELCTRKPPMIDPFVPKQIRQTPRPRGLTTAMLPCISYGLSSCGYDIRLAEEFRVFAPRYDKIGVVDPKKFDDRLLKTHKGPDCLIPPRGYVLARSLERFHMPEDVAGVVWGKSTYARCGIIVNVTPLEPGWKGVLTLEISNSCELPALIYAGEGIAQVLFSKLPMRPSTTYEDRGGKYDNQEGIESAKV